MRIRVYLDRTDHLWRVCGVTAPEHHDAAAVAARLQELRGGLGYPSWTEAMAAAGRMAAKSRRVQDRVIAAAAAWRAQR